MNIKDDFQKIKEDYQSREKEITELLIATNAILKSQNFNVTAKKVFDSCANVIGAKAGYVALLSDDGAENELLFLEDGGMRCTVSPELPMPIRGLRETAYRTGKVVYDNDFMKSDWVKYMPKGHMPLRNVLFSPLNIERKTVGIMGFACKDGDFTDNDAKMASAFGNYAAIALQNSQTMEELIVSNRTKDKFFSIIAHDLKTPFNTIIGFSEHLAEQVKEKNYNKIDEITGFILKSSNVAMDLLNNLMTWSRLESGKMPFKAEPFDIGDITSETVNLIIATAKQKSIDVENKVSPNMQVFADREMISTVLRNLISNALKFTHTAGKITISSTTKDKELHISITDNGVGIAKERMVNLFALDKNNSTLGTNKEKGTGLGLVLCKEFIEKNGGSIWAESTVGEGTTFTFSIPLNE